MTQYYSVICFLHPFNYLSCQSECHIWICLTQLMDYRDIFALASPSKTRQLECSKRHLSFFRRMLGFCAFPPPPQDITWTAKVWFGIIICMCSSLASSVESRVTNLPLGNLFKNIHPHTGRKDFCLLVLTMFYGTCQITVIFFSNYSRMQPWNCRSN